MPLYSATFTRQKHQLNKRWFDGFLSVDFASRKLTVLDENKRIIDTKLVRKDTNIQQIINDTIETEKLLVSVEELISASSDPIIQSPPSSLSSSSSPSLPKARLPASAASLQPAPSRSFSFTVTGTSAIPANPPEDYSPAPINLGKIKKLPPPPEEGRTTEEVIRLLMS